MNGKRQKNNRKEDSFTIMWHGEDRDAMGNFDEQGAKEEQQNQEGLNKFTPVLDPSTVSGLNIN